MALVLLYETAAVSLAEAATYSYQSVVETWPSKLNSELLTLDPSLIVHLQDVHNDPHAQKNAAEILKQIGVHQKTRGLNSPMVVAIEGYWAPLDTDRLASFSDKEARRRVFERYLAQGRLFGEEARAFMDAPGSWRIIGIEDRELYLENGKAQQAVESVAPHVLPYIGQAKDTLRRLRARLAPPELRAFERRRRAFHENGAPLADYLQWAERNAGSDVFAGFPALSAAREAHRLESRIDPARVERERNGILKAAAGKPSREELSALLAESVAFRTGRKSAADFHESLLGWARRFGVEAPGLKDYARLLRMGDRLSPEAVLKELPDFEAGLQDRFAAGAAGASDLSWILAAGRWLEIQEKAWLLGMTPDEFTRFKGLASRIEWKSLHGRLAALSVRHDLPVFEGVPPAELTSRAAEVRRFYELALKRDEAMVKNFLAIPLPQRGRGQGEGGSGEPPHPNPLPHRGRGEARMIVLIAGGFHTPGITRRLREKGLAFGVARPAIGRRREGDTYRAQPFSVRQGFEAGALRDLATESSGTGPVDSRASRFPELSAFAVRSGRHLEAAANLAVARPVSFGARILGRLVDLTLETRSFLAAWLRTIIRSPEFGAFLVLAASFAPALAGSGGRSGTAEGVIVAIAALAACLGFRWIVPPQRTGGSSPGDRRGPLRIEDPIERLTDRMSFHVASAALRRLEKLGISTVGDLTFKMESELRNVWGFGPQSDSMKQIRRLLEESGLGFRPEEMRVYGINPERSAEANRFKNELLEVLLLQSLRIRLLRAFRQLREETHGAPLTMEGLRATLEAQAAGISQIQRRIKEISSDLTFLVPAREGALRFAAIHAHPSPDCGHCDAMTRILQAVMNDIGVPSLAVGYALEEEGLARKVDMDVGRQRGLLHAFVRVPVDSGGVSGWAAVDLAAGQIYDDPGGLIEVTEFDGYMNRLGERLSRLSLPMSEEGRPVWTRRMNAIGVYGEIRSRLSLPLGPVPPGERDLYGEAMALVEVIRNTSFHGASEAEMDGAADALDETIAALEAGRAARAGLRDEDVPTFLHPSVFPEALRRLHPYWLRAQSEIEEDVSFYREHDGAYYVLRALREAGRLPGNLVIINVDPHSDTGISGPNIPNAATWVNDAMREGLARAYVQVEFVRGSPVWRLHERDEARPAGFSHRVISEDELIEIIGPSEVFLTVDADAFSLRGYEDDGFHSVYHHTPGRSVGLAGDVNRVFERLARAPVRVVLAQSPAWLSPYAGEPAEPGRPSWIEEWRDSMTRLYLSLRRRISGATPAGSSRPSPSPGTWRLWAPLAGLLGPTAGFAIAAIGESFLASWLASAVGGQVFVALGWAGLNLAIHALGVFSKNPWTGEWEVVTAGNPRGPPGRFWKGYASANLFAVGSGLLAFFLASQGFNLQTIFFWTAFVHLIPVIFLLLPVKLQKALWGMLYSVVMMLPLLPGTLPSVLDIPAGLRNGVGTFMPFFQMRTEKGGGTTDFKTMEMGIDIHAETGQNIIQLAPFNRNALNSPYLVDSSRAIDPLYVSIESLLEQFPVFELRQFVEENRTRLEELRAQPTVNYDAERELKRGALNALWQGLLNGHDREMTGRLERLHEEFARYRRDNADWLPDHMLYLVLKEEEMKKERDRGVHWTNSRMWDWRLWSEGLRHRDPAAITEAMDSHRREIDFESFVQFIADRQFNALKRYAEGKGVELMVDIPFALNGADIWINPEVFGLKRENDYQRMTTQGVPPEPAYPAGQYWQFYPYDWSNPATMKFILDLFKFNQGRASHIRLDHVLGYYRTYHFTEDIKGRMTLRALGIFDRLQEIKAAALRGETTKAEAARRAWSLIKVRLTEFRDVVPPELRDTLPQDAVSLTLDDSGNLIRDSMVMVARRIPRERHEERPVGRWQRQYVVEKAVFNDEQKWDFIRLTPNDQAGDAGFMEDYLFGGDLEADDSLRLGYFKLAPGERMMSKFLSAAQKAGTTLIWETLGVVPTPIQESVERLGGTNYLPMIWGEVPFWGAMRNPFHPQHHLYNAYVTYGLHDSNSMKARWEKDLSVPVKKKVLGGLLGWWGWNREDLTTLTPRVRKALLRQVYSSRARIAVLDWIDLLGLGDEFRLNTPGVQEGQWIKRLPRNVSLEKLLAAVRGDIENSTPEALEAIALMRELAEGGLRGPPVLDPGRIKLLEVNPETGGQVVQIRKGEEPFLVDAYVKGRPGGVTLEIRGRDGFEVGVTMSPTEDGSRPARHGMPSGIVKWRAEWLPPEGQSGRYEFRVRIEDTGETSGWGTLIPVPEGSDLNPQSDGFILKEDLYSAPPAPAPRPGGWLERFKWWAAALIWLSLTGPVLGQDGSGGSFWSEPIGIALMIGTAFVVLYSAVRIWQTWQLLKAIDEDFKIKAAEELKKRSPNLQRVRQEIFKREKKKEGWTDSYLRLIARRLARIEYRLTGQWPDDVVRPIHWRAGRAILSLPAAIFVQFPLFVVGLLWGLVQGLWGLIQGTPGFFTQTLPGWVAWLVGLWPSAWLRRQIDRAAVWGQAVGTGFWWAGWGIGWLFWGGIPATWNHVAGLWPKEWLQRQYHRVIGWVQMVGVGLVFAGFLILWWASGLYDAVNRMGRASRAPPPASPGLLMARLEYLLGQISTPGISEQELGNLSSSISATVRGIHPDVAVTLDLGAGRGKVEMMVEGKPYWTDEVYVVDPASLWTIQNDGSSMTRLPTDNPGFTAIHLNHLEAQFKRTSASLDPDQETIRVQTRFFGHGKDPAVLNHAVRFNDQRSLVALLTVIFAVSKADLLTRYRFEQAPEEDVGSLNLIERLMAQFKLDGHKAKGVAGAIEMILMKEPGMRRYLLEQIPFHRLILGHEMVDILLRLFRPEEQWRMPVAVLNHIVPRIRGDLTRWNVSGYMLSILADEVPFITGGAVGAVHDLVRRERGLWEAPEDNGLHRHVIDFLEALRTKMPLRSEDRIAVRGALDGIRGDTRSIPEPVRRKVDDLLFQIDFGSMPSAQAEGRPATVLGALPPAQGIIRVLYLEDDPDMREAMLRYVLEDRRFKITAVANGLEGWAHLEAGEEFDLILSNGDMPGTEEMPGDGFTFFKRVREIYPQYVSRFAFSTAYSEASVYERIGQTGIPVVSKRSLIPLVPTLLGLLPPPAASVPESRLPRWVQALPDRLALAGLALLLGAGVTFLVLVSLPGLILAAILLPIAAFFALAGRWLPWLGTHGIAGTIERVMTIPSLQMIARMIFLERKDWLANEEYSGPRPQPAGSSLLKESFLHHFDPAFPLVHVKRSWHQWIGMAMIYGGAASLLALLGGAPVSSLFAGEPAGWLGLGWMYLLVWAGGLGGHAAYNGLAGLLGWKPLRIAGDARTLTASDRKRLERVMELIYAHLDPQDQAFLASPEEIGTIYKDDALAYFRRTGGQAPPDLEDIHAFTVQINMPDGTDRNIIVIHPPAFEDDAHLLVDLGHELQMLFIILRNEVFETQNAVEIAGAERAVRVLDRVLKDPDIPEATKAEIRRHRRETLVSIEGWRRAAPIPRASRALPPQGIPEESRIHWSVWLGLGGVTAGLVGLGFGWLVKRRNALRAAAPKQSAKKPGAAQPKKRRHRGGRGTSPGVWGAWKGLGLKPLPTFLVAAIGESALAAALLAVFPSPIALGLWAVINWAMHSRGVYATNAAGEWSVIAPGSSRSPPGRFHRAFTFAVAAAGLALLAAWLSVAGFLPSLTDSTFLNALLWSSAIHSGLNLIAYVLAAVLREKADPWRREEFRALPAGPAIIRELEILKSQAPDFTDLIDRLISRVEQAAPGELLWRTRPESLETLAQLSVLRVIPVPSGIAGFDLAEWGGLPVERQEALIQFVAARNHDGLEAGDRRSVSVNPHLGVGDKTARRAAPVMIKEGAPLRIVLQPRIQDVADVRDLNRYLDEAFVLQRTSVDKAGNSFFRIFQDPGVVDMARHPLTAGGDQFVTYALNLARMARPGGGGLSPTCFLCEQKILDSFPSEVGFRSGPVLSFFNPDAAWSPARRGSPRGLPHHIVDTWGVGHVPQSEIHKTPYLLELLQNWIRGNKSFSLIGRAIYRFFINGLGGGASQNHIHSQRVRKPFDAEEAHVRWRSGSHSQYPGVRIGTAELVPAADGHETAVTIAVEAQGERNVPALAAAASDILERIQGAGHPYGVFGFEVPHPWVKTLAPFGLGWLAQGALWALRAAGFRFAEPRIRLFLTARLSQTSEALGQSIGATQVSKREVLLESLFGARLFYDLAPEQEAELAAAAEAAGTEKWGQWGLAPGAALEPGRAKELEAAQKSAQVEVLIRMGEEGRLRKRDAAGLLHAYRRALRESIVGKAEAEALIDTWLSSDASPVSQAAVRMPGSWLPYEWYRRGLAWWVEFPLSLALALGAAAILPVFSDLSPAGAAGLTAGLFHGMHLIMKVFPAFSDYFRGVRADHEWRQLRSPELLSLTGLTFLAAWAAFALGPWNPAAWIAALIMTGIHFGINLPDVAGRIGIPGFSKFWDGSAGLGLSTGAAVPVLLAAETVLAGRSVTQAARAAMDPAGPEHRGSPKEDLPQGSEGGIRKIADPAGAPYPAPAVDTESLEIAWIELRGLVRAGQSKEDGLEYFYEKNALRAFVDRELARVRASAGGRPVRLGFVYDALGSKGDLRSAPDAAEMRGENIRRLLRANGVPESVLASAVFQDVESLSDPDAAREIMARMGELALGRGPLRVRVIGSAAMASFWGQDIWRDQGFVVELIDFLDPSRPVSLMGFRAEALANWIRATYSADEAGRLLSELLQGTAEGPIRMFLPVRGLDEGRLNFLATESRMIEVQA